MNIDYVMYSLCSIHLETFKDLLIIDKFKNVNFQFLNNFVETWNTLIRTFCIEK